MSPDRSTEGQLKNLLLLAAPREIPNLRLFRRNISVVHIGDRTVRHGIKGQADLVGYVVGGRVIEIELKSESGVLSREQRAWACWCETWGVPHVVLRAAANESAENTIARWIAQLRQLTG
jgi:hypothetical protein